MNKGMPASADPRRLLRPIAGGGSALVLMGMGMGLAACGEGGDGRGTAVQVDTLAGGVVAVTTISDGVWGAEEEWQLEEELRLGSSGSVGPELFGTVVALGADPEGRIFVLDNQARQLRVFDADGTHLRSLGREGAGPGEFRNPVGLALHPDGSVWVVDPGNGRYTVFGPDGTLRSTHPRPFGYFAWPWPGGFDREGRLYDVAGPESFVRLSPDLLPRDTMALPEDNGRRIHVTRGDGAGMMSLVPPFSPRMHWQFDPRGYLWSASSGSFRFLQRRLAGDTVRIARRDHSPVPVTAAERDSIREVLESSIASWGEGVVVEGDLRVPDHKPAFQAFQVDDDGYLWVDSYVESGRARRLEVFGPDGVHLGPVGIDPGLETVNVRPYFRTGRLYAVVRDEFGVENVVRYRIAGKSRDPPGPQDS